MIYRYTKKKSIWHLNQSANRIKALRKYRWWIYGLVYSVLLLWGWTQAAALAITGVGISEWLSGIGVSIWLFAIITSLLLFGISHPYRFLEFYWCQLSRKSRLDPDVIRHKDRLVNELRDMMGEPLLPKNAPSSTSPA